MNDIGSGTVNLGKSRKRKSRQELELHSVGYCVHVVLGFCFCMGVYSPLLKGRQSVFCSGHVFVRSGHVLFVAAMFFC